MQNIIVRKQDGVSYRRPIKAYDIVRGAEVVGTVQTWGVTWEVFDRYLNRVTSHTTIKAAVRVAGKVL